MFNKFFAQAFQSSPCLTEQSGSSYITHFDYKEKSQHETEPQTFYDSFSFLQIQLVDAAHKKMIEKELGLHIQPKRDQLWKKIANDVLTNFQPHTVAKNHKSRIHQDEKSTQNHHFGSRKLNKQLRSLSLLSHIRLFPQQKNEQSPDRQTPQQKEIVDNEVQTSRVLTKQKSYLQITSKRKINFIDLQLVTSQSIISTKQTQIEQSIQIRRKSCYCRQCGAIPIKEYNNQHIMGCIKQQTPCTIKRKSSIVVIRNPSRQSSITSINKSTQISKIGAKMRGSITAKTPIIKKAWQAQSEIEEQFSPLHARDTTNKRIKTEQSRTKGKMFTFGEINDAKSFAMVPNSITSQGIVDYFNKQRQLNDKKDKRWSAILSKLIDRSSNNDKSFQKTLYHTFELNKTNSGLKQPITSLTSARKPSTNKPSTIYTSQFTITYQQRPQTQQSTNSKPYLLQCYENNSSRKKSTSHFKILTPLNLNRNKSIDLITQKFSTSPFMKSFTKKSTNN